MCAIYPSVLLQGHWPNCEHYSDKRPLQWRGCHDETLQWYAGRRELRAKRFSHLGFGWRSNRQQTTGNV